MVHTSGLCVVANAVATKYDLDMKSPSRVPRSMYPSSSDLFLYRSGNDMMLIVNSGTRVSRFWGEREDALRSTCFSMGFEFKRFGGVDIADVWVDHPEADGILERINWLTREYSGISIPREPIEFYDKDGKPDYSRYRKVELWADEVYKDFGVWGKLVTAWKEYEHAWNAVYHDSESSARSEAAQKISELEGELGLAPTKFDKDEFATAFV